MCCAYVCQTPHVEEHAARLEMERAAIVLQRWWRRCLQRWLLQGVPEGVRQQRVMNEDSIRWAYLGLGCRVYLGFRV
jgi:IQ calmodulin-binding motif